LFLDQQSATPALLSVLTCHVPNHCAHAGEPHFIPNPTAAAATNTAASGTAAAAEQEDDGVVLSQCVDAQGRAFLLVLDAPSWKELGRAVLPYSTPYRFHGVWVPNGSDGLAP
jgi:carotenoid cleavage dioxygenase-like enzyme